MTTQKKTVEEFGNRTPIELLEATVDDICYDPELRMRAKARCHLALNAHASSAVAAREAELRRGVEDLTKFIKKRYGIVEEEGQDKEMGYNEAIDDVLKLLPENKSTDL